MTDKDTQAIATETPATGFEGLGIDPKILQIIKDGGLVEPTPIQRQSLPVSLTGQDVFGIAQTGTGKTLAFGIPMIQKLLLEPGLGLVILPTRELAMQVDLALQRLGRPLNIRTALLIGGEPISKQLRALHMRPRLVIVTPGRLIDHLEQKTVKLDNVKVLVLDEADRMLEMGFAPQLNRILEVVPKERLTMMFSATMPSAIVDIAKQFMKMPIRVEVAPSGSVVSTIAQEVVFIHKADKLEVLKKILSEQKEKTLIFAKTKFGTKKLAAVIESWGIPTTELHSNRTLKQRMSSLAGFKAGKYDVMVATDIAARGIDAKGIGLVINFDLPTQVEDYVHRIGRTGRAGKSGRALTLATIDQRRDIKNIERLIGTMLPIKKVEGFEVPYLREESSGGFAGGRSGSARSFGGNRFGARRSSGRPSFARPRFGGRPGLTSRKPAR